MNYDLIRPCAECPFLQQHKKAYTEKRLLELSASEFPCHKTAELVSAEDGGSTYQATESSSHCAGALIFLEKRQQPNQMMRICERLGMYDASKLDMTADVR